MAKVIKNFINVFVTGFFANWLEDFFVFVGLGFLIVNTYFIGTVTPNVLAGNYLLGTVLIGLGIVLAKR